MLTWKTNPKGAKVVKLVVTAPKGSKISISCTHHGCSAPRAFTVKKTAAFRPIGAVGPVAKPPAGLKMTAADSSGGVAAVDSAASPARFQAKAQVHAAKQFKLLKGKILKAGSKLIIRVTAPGYIGKYFSYPVTKRGVSAKTISCTNPSSSKPHKKCG